MIEQGSREDSERWSQVHRLEGLTLNRHKNFFTVTKGKKARMGTD